MSSTRSKIVAQLRTAIASEDLEDPQWVLELEDVDEPPLFSRVEQVDVLRDLPEEERGPILLCIALEYLSSIAQLLANTDAMSQRYFACVTVSDFDEVTAGNQPVATVAIQVDPHDQRRQDLRRFSAPNTEEAIAVANWLRFLGADTEAKYVVGELRPAPVAELRRVYVGFRESQCRGLRSVGDYYVAQEASDPGGSGSPPDVC